MMNDNAKKSDIYKLYDLYHSYKKYYDYYWNSGLPGGKTLKEIREKKQYMLEHSKSAETAFEILCWFAGVNPVDIEDLNGFDTLRCIERENFYDKIDD